MARFSVRSLLILTLIVAVGIAFFLYRKDRRIRALRAAPNASGQLDQHFRRAVGRGTFTRTHRSRTGRIVVVEKSEFIFLHDGGKYHVNVLRKEGDQSYLLPAQRIGVFNGHQTKWVLDHDTQKSGEVTVGDGKQDAYGFPMDLLHLDRAAITFFDLLTTSKVQETRSKDISLWDFRAELRLANTGTKVETTIAGAGGFRFTEINLFNARRTSPYRTANIGWKEDGNVFYPYKLAKARMTPRPNEETTVVEIDEIRRLNEDIDPWIFQFDSMGFTNPRIDVYEKHLRRLDCADFIAAARARYPDAWWSREGAKR